MKQELSNWNGLKIFLACLIGLMPMAALAHETDVDQANRAGGLRIGWVSQDKTDVLIDDPNLLKETLDLGWDQLRTVWLDELIRSSDQWDDADRFQLTSKLASTKQADLHVTPIENGAALNYVVHHNALGVTLQTDISWAQELSYLITYDIEISGTVQTPRAGQQLRFRNGAIHFENVQIEGRNFVSTLALPLVEFLIEKLIDSVEEISKKLLPAVEDLLGELPAFSSGDEWLPQETFYASVGVEEETSALLVCFKTTIIEQCVFED